MINRYQRDTLELLESFAANLDHVTYNNFIGYLSNNSNYTEETRQTVDQYLQDSEKLSEQFKQLISATVILQDYSDAEAGRKVVRCLGRLVIEFPNSSLFMQALGRCFEKGAMVEDLEENVRSRLFPQGGMKWDAIGCMTFCFAKTLVLNPEVFYAWELLSMLFDENAISVADLPQEFLPLINQCAGNERLDNVYCSDFCEQKADELLAQSRKIEMEVENPASTSFAQWCKKKESEVEAQNKRKREEISFVVVSNKMTKMNLGDTPRMNNNNNVNEEGQSREHSQNRTMSNF
jgi:hypothetical protein